MERYIIPFDHQGRSFYVFIDKDSARKLYLVGKILPFTDEVYPSMIPFNAIASFDVTNPASHSLESAIMGTLYRFLEARGWLAFAN